MLACPDATTRIPEVQWTWALEASEAFAALAQPTVLTLNDAHTRPRAWRASRARRASFEFLEMGPVVFGPMERFQPQVVSRTWGG